MVRYFVPHDRVRERLRLGVPSRSFWESSFWPDTGRKRRVAIGG